MATFFNLPVPAGNGNGASVDVSTLSGSRTVTIDKSNFSGIILLEGSDDNVNFASVARFDSGSQKQSVILLACQFVRVRRTGAVPEIPAVPVVQIGAATSSDRIFGTLAVAAGDGAGAAFDISTGGDLITIIGTGTFNRAVYIEGSQDGGVTWSRIEDLGKFESVRVSNTIATFNRLRTFSEQSAGGDAPVVMVGSMPLDTCSCDVVPSWSNPNVGYFAIDQATGNDATGDVDVQAPLYDYTGVGGFPVAKRFKTFAGFRTKFPVNGEGRMFVLLLGAGTYAEDWDWRGIDGYSYPLRRASDLTNSVADKNQCAFKNAQGGTVHTVDVAPGVNGWNVVGAPLAADAWVGKRFRFLTGTAAGKTGTVIRNTAAFVEPNLNISAGISAGDTFQFEEPAVLFQRCYEMDGVALPPASILSASVIDLDPTVGIRWTSTDARSVYLGKGPVAGAGLTYVGCEVAQSITGSAVVNCSPGDVIRISRTYRDEGGIARTLGAYFRDDGPGPNFLGAAYLSIASYYAVGVPVAAQQCATFGGNRQLLLNESGAFRSGFRVIPSGVSDASQADPTILAANNAVGPSSVATLRPVRVYGPSTAANNLFGFGVIGRGVVALNVDVQNVGAVPAVKVIGSGGAGVVLRAITGTTGNTDVGLDLTLARSVRVILEAGNTVSGGVGSIRVNGGQIQSHANYTVASYHDDGENLIQGTAKNTSLPILKFSGFHSGTSEVTRNSWLADPGTPTLPILVDQSYPMPARWVGLLKVIAITNTATTAVTVTVMKNGVATGLTCTIPVGSIGVVITTAGAPEIFAANDLLSLRAQSTDNTGDTAILATLELR
jgi:hypothetical protein